MSIRNKNTQLLFLTTFGCTKKLFQFDKLLDNFNMSVGFFFCSKIGEICDLFNIFTFSLHTEYVKR